MHKSSCIVRGERGDGEDPVGSQQVHAGNGGGTGWRGLGGLNPTRVTKIQRHARGHKMEDTYPSLSAQQTTSGVGRRTNRL